MGGGVFVGVGRLLEQEEQGYGGSDAAADEACDGGAAGGVFDPLHLVEGDAAEGDGEWARDDEAEGGQGDDAEDEGCGAEAAAFCGVAGDGAFHGEGHSAGATGVGGDGGVGGAAGADDDV